MLLSNQKIIIMAKVAKLVTMSVTKRVVVDEEATDLEIMETAHPECVNAILQDGVFEHLESIVLDEECPYKNLEGE
jgi:hypothetical protein